MNEIIKMRNGVWRIEDNGVRFFVIEGEEKAALIDSGREVPNAFEIATGLTKKPLIMMNTHADNDHISGNLHFSDIYMNPAEFSFYHKKVPYGQNMHALWEGDLIDLGNHVLEVISLPGHTPGSIAFLDYKYHVLISGDPILKDGTIFMWGEARDIDAYILSLQHLKKWDGQFTEIWPSHASIPVAPSMIDELIEQTLLILKGSIFGNDIELHGNKITSYTINSNTMLLDRKE